MTSDSHQFSAASKNLSLANGDGVDEVEPGKAAQTPYQGPQRWWRRRWKNQKQLWPRGSVITSQLLETKHRTTFKITENIELVALEPSLFKILYGPLR